MHGADSGCANCRCLTVAAPPEFRGDLSGCTGISWEEYIPDADLSYWPEGHTKIILIGLDGTRFDTTNPPSGPLHTWISRYAPFEESAWQRVKGMNSFAEVLQNVQHLLMLIDVSCNTLSTDEAYVDNVRLIGKTAFPTFDLPTIISQPVDQWRCPGEAVTFQVVASGAAPLRYQWQFFPRHYVNWWEASFVNLPGEINAQLTVANSPMANNVNYRVAVFNDCGSTTSDAPWLYENEAPRIIEQPTSQVVVEGTNVTFEVHTAGGCVQQWQRNGTNLPPSRLLKYLIILNKYLTKLSNNYVLREEKGSAVRALDCSRSGS